MTIEIDGPAFEAGDEVCTFTSGRVSSSGAAEAVHLSEAPGRIYVSARGHLRSALSGDPSMTLIVEDSANGSAWATIASFAFTGSGKDSAAADSPRAYLRARWVVSGKWEAEVDVVSLASAGGGGGGSQPSVVRLLGLVDDFAVDALATKWPNATRAVVANGILDLTNAFSANAGSAVGYDMTGGQVKMKMVEGSQYAWLEVQNNDSGDFLTVGYFEDSPGVFKVILRSTADGVLTVDLATVDEVIPQWLRITEADGTLTVDVSYDGQEWLFATTRSTAAVFTGGFGGVTNIYFEIEGPGGNVVTKLEQFVFLKAT